MKSRSTASFADAIDTFNRNLEDVENEVGDDVHFKRINISSLTQISLEKYDTIFKNMDIDGDGHLDPDEFSIAMSYFGHSLDEDYVDALLRSADANHDGNIDFDEFCALVMFIEAESNHRLANDLGYALVAKWLFILIVVPLVIIIMWTFIPLSDKLGDPRASYHMFSYAYHASYVFVALIFGFATYSLVVPIPSKVGCVLISLFLTVAGMGYDQALRLSKTTWHLWFSSPAIFFPIFTSFLIILFSYVMYTTRKISFKEMASYSDVSSDIDFEDVFSRDDLFDSAGTSKSADDDFLTGLEQHVGIRSTTQAYMHRNHMDMRKESFEDLFEKEYDRCNGHLFFFFQFVFMTILLQTLILLYYWCQFFTYIYVKQTKDNPAGQVILALVFPFSLKPFEIGMMLLSGILDEHNRTRDLNMRHLEHIGEFCEFDVNLHLHGVPRRRGRSVLPLTYWMTMLFNMLFYRNLFSAVDSWEAFTIIALLNAVKMALLFPGRMAPFFSTLRFNVLKRIKNFDIPAIFRGGAAEDFDFFTATETFNKQLVIKFYFTVAAQLFSILSFIIFLLHQRYHYNRYYFEFEGAGDSDQFSRLLQYALAMMVVEGTAAVGVAFLIERVTGYHAFRIGTKSLWISDAVVPLILITVHVVQDVYFALVKHEFRHYLPDD